MRQAALVGLMGLMLLAAGCSRDPIVGRWAVTGPAGASQAIEFKADGTAAVDFTELEKRMQEMSAGNPVARDSANKALQRMKQAKMTWKKVDKLYEMRTEVPGQAPQPPGYAKIEGDRLQICDKTGKAAGPALTREK
jgi:hypothetical protein